MAFSLYRSTGTGYAWLWLVVLGLTAMCGFSDCRDVECYKCSWIGNQELDEEKEKALDEHRKDQSSLTTPVDNPLTNPYISWKVMPDSTILQSSCDTCKLTNGFCAQWTFILNDTPQNATYMCVQSVSGGDTGLYEEKLPGGGKKRVIICNNKNFCNESNGAFKVKPSYLFFVLSVLLILNQCSIFKNPS